MKNKNTTDNNLVLGRRTFLAASVPLVVGVSSIAVSNVVSATEKPPSLFGAGPLADLQLGPKKAWAKQKLRGGESFILPSLTPDFKTLDEKGIRRDVQHSIAQGFCSIMPLPIGIDSKTDQRMQAIVADEAKNKINMVGIIRAGQWSSMKDSVRRMEKQGISHVLMYFNPKLSTQEAMLNEMREVIENTSLGIVLYAKPSSTITHLDPTGLPLDVFDQLANLDNVVGIKFTQELRPATAFAVANRLGDRLLLGVVDLEAMLPLSLKYNMQWTGQWGIDSLQSPEKPWVNQFLALLSKGKNEEASKLYWQYEPIASAFYKLQAPSLSIGGHPWLHIKYMKWLTGGNGGLLADLNESADYVPHLDPAGRAQCREIFQRVGIKITELPDEAFAVGNTAYEKGVRAKDLLALPQYIA